MYARGDVVIYAAQGERRVGEVCAVRPFAGGQLYDVSLEDVVAKGVLEEELRPATAEVLRGLLSRYEADPAFATLAPPGRDDLRRLALRECYVDFLRQALPRLEAADSLTPAAPSFSAGDLVALREEGAWLLGMVCAVSRGPHAGYVVDVAGDVRHVGEDELVALGEVRAASPLALGERRRFLAAGHEADDAYCGMVCLLRETGDTWEYGLMFDDGDVLEGLSARDLR